MSWKDKARQRVTASPELDFSGGRPKLMGWQPDMVPFEDSPASVADGALSGFIDDPQSKINFFASKRFPDDPKAKDRYGLHRGDVVYVDDEGKLQKEVAGWADLARAATEYGPGFVGGAAGAMSSGPVGAATLAAGGEAWRKNIGSALGDEQTAGGNAAELAAIATVDWMGAKVGKGIGKFINRRSARDITDFDVDATVELVDLAKQYGIEITPAEASNLGSLINQQTRIGTGFDDAGDMIKKFYERRMKQEASAVESFIGDTPNPEIAGRSARDVAQTTIDDAKVARTTASEPIYNIGVRDDVRVPDEVLQSLENDPLIWKHMEKIANDPTYGLDGVPRDSTRFLDATKKTLDAEAEMLASRGDKYRAGVVGEAASRVRGMTDDIYPVYGEARSAFASQSGEVEALEQGIEGVLARVQDTSLKNQAQRLFSPTANKYDIGKMRNAFKSQGQGEEWNDLVNVYLRETWEKQNTTQAGDISKAGNWRKSVYGSVKARDNIRSALGPERFQDFENLMKVLEASQRVPKGQSMTQPAAQAAAREKFEAAPVAEASKGFGVGGLREYWANARVDSWREDLARVITNDLSLAPLEQLRHLKSLNPRSEKAIQAVTTSLSHAGLIGSRTMLSSQPSQMPQTQPK